MAFSIIIDAKFWDDPRFIELKIQLGEAQAIGYCVVAWRVGTSYWKTGEKLIPKKTWKGLSMPRALISTGFAQDKHEGIYVLGVKEHVHRHSQRVESAKKAGERSAEQRKKNLNENNETGQRGVDVALTNRQLFSSLSLSLEKKEKKEESAELSQSASIPPPLISDPVCQQLLLGRVKHDLVAMWVQVYGTEFTTEEIRKAAVWLKANAQRAPKSNLGRFLSNWLSKGWETYRKTIPSNRPGEKIQEKKTDLRELEKLINGG